MKHLENMKEHFKGGKLRKFKRYMGLALIVLVTFLALNSAWDLFGKWGWVSSFDEARTITISASGEAVASPDTASFSASVVTRGNDPETVQDDNTEVMNEVIDYLKDGGVEEDDIKTAGYNLFPRYNYIDGRQIPQGYELNQTIQVVVRDLDKAGGLLSGVVGKGANQVSSIQFYIDDPDVFKNKARQEAFDKARTKARQMARQAGVGIGKVVSFSESSGGYPPIMFAESALVDAGRGGGGAPSVEPGTQNITVSVTVTYEIK